ncbi:hypothetical protein [Bacillus cereus]|jgi:hypothetical protein|uniref:hypothetical protein n=1 Tax=Bacillus cereus TaxID=1396 RepID=UPI000BF36962|nr:hypothetical protein [Bacillus cereus]PFO85783.1 hypothetical protein COJ89_26920 [Bacillus cereus]PGQ61969.1 hypothetical protein COA21_29655 [Bacillus cereus]PGU13404.1 hypothetical protein COD21_02195 [Bacillus cereus]PGY68800.1 hypothetical protein COE42_23285 [Bacillus cereus]
MMIFDDINLPIALFFLFFIIFLGNKGKDASTLCLSLLFGGMVVDYWLNIKGLNDTYISMAWNVFYCIIMIILIPIMIHKTIKNIKYIKAKIKRNRAM